MFNVFAHVRSRLFAFHPCEAVAATGSRRHHLRLKCDGAKRHVRFTPESARKSGLRRKVVSVADIDTLAVAEKKTAIFEIKYLALHGFGEFVVK